MKDVPKTSTIFIRGLNTGTDSDKLTESFNSFGRIRQAFVTRPKGHSSVNPLGYVKFTTIQEATDAIAGVKKIDGKRIIVTYARKKPRKFRQPKAGQEPKEDKDGSGLSESDDNSKPTAKPTPAKPKKRKRSVSPAPQITEPDDSLPSCSKTIHILNLAEGLTDKDVRKKCRKIGAVEKIVVQDNSAAVTFESEESVKTAVKKLNNHVFKQKVITVLQSNLPGKMRKKLSTPSRLVIRNLSFKITLEALRTELETFGRIQDLSVPLTDAGRMRGFAFVSYINKFEANKALQKLNGKELFGRKIAVDWALGKEEYSKHQKKSKEEEESEDEEAEDEDEGGVGSQEEDEEEEKEEKDDEAEAEADADEEVAEDEDGSEDDAQGDDEEEGSESGGDEVSPPKKEYNDIQEGRTLFVNNIPFDAEKEDLEEVFSEFGAVRYIRMLMDHEKDRPKGSAFVQFSEKTAADSCLSQTLNFGGRELILKRAVEKGSLAAAGDEITGGKREKDSRNLHLAMEGIIKEGTKAAEGVSKSDMMKRKLAFESKKKKLKNLKHFVSNDRLCVRNMPAPFSEAELKKLMSKYGHVTQVKIMRDLKQANSQGIGKSKGFGFVQFSKHSAALAALRSVNNNPSVFTSQKRPIVDFSIENSSIVKARERKGARNQAPEKKEERTKKSFNQRWQEKRQKRKETKKNEAPAEVKETPASNSEETGGTKRKSSKKRKRERAQKKGKSESGPSPAEATPKQAAPVPAITPASAAPAKKGKGKSEREGKKQKREKSEGEEKQFQKLVDSYKGRLVVGSGEGGGGGGGDVGFKKWYED